MSRDREFEGTDWNHDAVKLRYVLVVSVCQRHSKGLNPQHDQSLGTFGAFDNFVRDPGQHPIYVFGLKDRTNPR